MDSGKARGRSQRWRGLTPSPHRPLYTFRFLALCLFMLLAYCNTAIFYTLYPYLESLGLPQGLRGATHGQGMVAASALVLGMGVGPPSLNALMYARSEPPVKAVNSNLMAMALQTGNFLGPILGGAAVGLFGQSAFLGVGFLANRGGVWLALIFLRRGWTGEARRGE